MTTKNLKAFLERASDYIEDEDSEYEDTSYTPVSGKERKFKNMHDIVVKDHPSAEEDQFTYDPDEEEDEYDDDDEDYVVDTYDEQAFIENFGIEQVMKIAKSKRSQVLTFANGDKETVDPTTASYVVQAYEEAKPRLRKAFENKMSQHPAEFMYIAGLADHNGSK